MSLKRRRSSSVATISDDSDDTQIREISHDTDLTSSQDDDDDDDGGENNASYDEEDDVPLRPATATPLASMYGSGGGGGGGSTRKRKKLDPSELCQQLYDSIRNVKKEDGNPLCDVFIRAPNRRSLPGYYEVVSNPIDLLRVQQKLKTDAYQNLDELMTDFELIVKNAKAYYQPESPEHQDACTLWELLNANKQKIISDLMDAASEVEPQPRNTMPRKSVGRPRKQPPPVIIDDDDEDIDVYEELFASLMTAFDASDKRHLYTEFQILPSRKLYPDYYSIIEQPIDLKLIATKIQNKEYDTLDDMERDLHLLVKNACTYNDPESQIYLDARSLKDIFTQKKLDLETGRAMKTQSKHRGQSLSAMLSALKEGDDMDDGNPKHTDAVMNRVFNQLHNYPNPLSKEEVIGATLWRLPNPRWERNFYEVTAKPISMSQIQQKIKKGLYRTFADMKVDFEQMCNNYLTACKPEHRLHVAAKQMRSVLDQTFAPVLEQTEESGGETVDTDTSSVMSSSTLSIKKPPPPPVSMVSTPTTSSSSPACTPAPSPAISQPSTPAPAPPPRTPPVQLPPAQPVVLQKIQPEIQRIPPQAKAKLNFHNALVKNKLLQIHKSLMEHVQNGRSPIKSFIEIPSYPVDMTRIERNIRADKYGSSIDDALADYRRMFTMCRQQNADGTLINEDAKVLEKFLNERARAINSNDNSTTTTIGATTIKKITTNGSVLRQIQRKPVSTPVIIQAVPTVVPTTLPSAAKYREFYDTIRDTRDTRTQRQLSFAFMRLPQRSEFPDYYERIKSPIDMERIFCKVKTQTYTSIDQLYEDFLTMLRNACSYYEKDTQIYKDSVELQRVCFETIRSLKADDNVVPDVQRTVQDLLVCLFYSLTAHEDADGRLYTDSLGDVPDHDIKNGQKVLGTTMELIKKRLDRGMYTRLDALQVDVFACLERARQVTKSNSQVFEDSIELQTFFITKRDELCKKGEILSSPALGYTSMHLSANIEQLRQAKILQEQIVEPDDDGTPILDGDSMIINDKLYSPGDFLYYACPEINAPGIMCVERLWINQENIPMMSGNLFLRPAQVIHSRSRKFIDKEVFKSDRHVAMPLNKLQGKCYVMSVKDYFKLRPEGFLERDLYVCESRYNSRTHAFKKIKTWNHVTNKVRLVQRETPIEMKRALIAKVERTIEEQVELESNVTVRPKAKPNVPVTIHGVEEGRTYYEQYNLPNLLLKTGDFVYAESHDPDKPSVVQVCAIYETRDGNSFFRGPYLKYPKDLPNTSARMFYKHEILLSTMTETTPTSSILGKCSILETPEYTTRRPTEVTEKDVFICESVYDEIKGQIRRLSKPGELKKILHSQMVSTDEVYFFPKPIIPPKVQIEVIDPPKPQVNNVLTEDELKAEISEFLDLNEDSMDIESLLPEAIVVSSPASQRTPPIGSPAPSTITNDTHEKSVRRSKTVTGFILFQSQFRRLRHEEHPGTSFGEVSRMLGEEWKNMGPVKRGVWKEKALKMNEEARAQAKIDNPELFLNQRSSTNNQNNRDGPTGVQIFNNLRENPLPNQLFDCCWHDCDYEFEDPQDLLDHTLSSKTACIQSNIKTNVNGVKDYECRWRTCNRIKRSLGGFPDWARLLRHIREVHIYRHPGKTVQPEKRSVNFVTRRNQIESRSHTPVLNDSKSNSPTVPSPAGSPCLTTSQIIESSSLDANPNTTTGPTAEPLFITVPPRPSRVLHSEAYIRYIESLNKKAASTLSIHSKALRATQETTPPADPTKLPAHWLGKKAQEHPDRVVNALWNLRHFMMKDVLALYRLK